MLNCLLLCFPSRARNIKDKEQNRQMNKNIVNLEPELSGNCSWTKFAGEELKILAPLQKRNQWLWFRIVQHIYWYDSAYYDSAFLYYSGLCRIFMLITQLQGSHFLPPEAHSSFHWNPSSLSLRLSWLKFLTLTLTLWWLEVGWEDDSCNRKLVEATVFAPNLRLVGYSRWQSLI